MLLWQELLKTYISTYMKQRGWITHYIISFVVLLCCLSTAFGEQKIYWSESDPVLPSSNSIFRMNLDGSNVELIIDGTSIGKRPTALEFNDVKGLLYWMDAIDSSLFVSNPEIPGDYAEARPGNFGVNGNPRQIAMDSRDFNVPVLYWTDSDSIFRRALPDVSPDESVTRPVNGAAISATRELAFFGGGAGTGIISVLFNDYAAAPHTIDDEIGVRILSYMDIRDEVLWYSAASSKIKSKAYNASAVDPATILVSLTPGNQLTGIAADRTADNIYWTDSGTSKIFKSSRLTSNPIAIANNIVLPKDIVISCGKFAPDGDGDNTPDCDDTCPVDHFKPAPGMCGCGNPDTDSDEDGTANCMDSCPADNMKITPGTCGCGNPDTDSDGDGIANCNEGCPTDIQKVAAGACGCGVADVDSDGDGTLSCNEMCPNDPLKTAPGVCGCGSPDIAFCGNPPTATPTVTPTLRPPTGQEPVRILTPNLKITEPPQVIVQNKTVTIIFEKFAGAATGKPPTKGKALFELLDAKTGKTTINYAVKVQNKSSKTKTITALNSKKNQITLKNLKAGNYFVSYRAEIVQNGKVVGKSGFSPKANFTIN